MGDHDFMTDDQAQQYRGAGVSVLAGVACLAFGAATGALYAFDFNMAASVAGVAMVLSAVVSTAAAVSAKAAARREQSPNLP